MLHDSVSRKFVDSVETDEWEVQSSDGWHPISSVNKTVPYEIYEVTLESGESIKCADTHILIGDEGEVFAQDSLGKEILTKSGSSLVKTVKKTGEFENMYDLSVDSEDHTYYTNSILSHNTSTVSAFFVWYVIFNSEKTCGILGNKASTARSILAKVKLSYELIPKWLQQGVVEWNKGSVEFENHSKIMAMATSSSASRGETFALVALDEYGFVPRNVADEFYASIYPTISSGTTSKIVITSTPNGMNHFYKFVKEAEEGVNGYTLVSANWKDIPGRDAKWEKLTRKTLGSDALFSQEYECEFLGTADTLISPRVLRNIPISSPEYSTDSTNVYENPIPGRSYVMTADTGRGIGKDYSAFVVTDVTELPYKVVMVYRENKCNPIVYPNILIAAAHKYNDAFIYIESNDLGGGVANSVYYDLEYENVLRTRGKDVSFTGKEIGVRTTKKSKAVGCKMLQQLVENNKYLIRDSGILEELTNFAAKGTSYAAENGHDDLAMCLVMFSYLTTHTVFEDLSSTDAKHKMLMEQYRQAEDDILPLGFMTNGEESEEDALIF